MLQSFNMPLTQRLPCTHDFDSFGRGKLIEHTTSTAYCIELVMLRLFNSCHTFQGLEHQWKYILNYPTYTSLFFGLKLNSHPLFLCKVKKENGFTYTLYDIPDLKLNSFRKFENIETFNALIFL